MTKGPVKVSIVVPLFNEAQTLPELNKLITETLDSTNYEYEILYVNDGSNDETLKILNDLPKPKGDIVVIDLKGNSGQTAALAAGFSIAQGQIIISMDGDLQHDPREIPDFIEKMDEGYDIVSGWRKDRVDPYWSRKLPSRVANWIMSKFSGIALHDFGTTYKAYRSEVIKSCSLYGEFHRFIPALIEGMKIQIIEIPIKSLPRVAGKSKYNLKRTFTVFFDLIRIKFLTHYLNRPLQIFGTFGFVLGCGGFMIALYLTYLKFFSGISIMTYRAPLFLLSILLMLVGSQFLTMGLLGEIIVKLYYKLPNVRTFTIKNSFRKKESRLE